MTVSLSEAFGDRIGQNKNKEFIMANMSYCRFENTCNALEDCYEHLFDDNLSDSERHYRDKLIQIAEDIVSDTETEEDN